MSIEDVRMTGIYRALEIPAVDVQGIGARSAPLGSSGLMHGALENAVCFLVVVVFDNTSCPSM